MDKYLVNGHNVFLIVGVCFIASVIFVHIMKKVAIFLHVLDMPDKKRKIHTKPMPLLGGIGIFLAFLLGYMLFAEKNNLMLSILISSFLIMLLGLFDDMTKSETPMPNKYKLLVQIIVACIIVFYGGLSLTKTTFLGLKINFASIPLLPEFLSILIIVGIINAFFPILFRLFILNSLPIVNAIKPSATSQTKSILLTLSIEVNPRPSIPS